MKPAASILLAFALAAALAAPAVQAQTKSPISFARGASSARVDGSIRGREFRDYTLRAAAGQMMRIDLQARTGSPYFNLLPPGSNDVAIHVGSSGGNRFEGLLDRSGLWTIRVYQMRNAGRRGSLASYRLSVAVTGRPAAARPRDAKVPGSGYHATAPVSCRFAPARPFQPCNAGVRRLGGGNAVVEIETGPGSMRRIEFRGGQPVNSNAGPISVTRQEDMFEIRIGFEVYRFPEAFVFGG